MLSRSLQRSSPQAICTFPPSSMLSRSLPANLFASYLHGFLSIQHAVSLPPSEAPSQRSSPQAISSVSCPSACCIAPSQRSSFPAKISASYFHGFLSVQHAVSLPPSEAFLKLLSYLHSSCPSSSMLSRSLPAKLSAVTISTVSHPSSMLHRSLPAKLSPSYFQSEALPKLFPRFPICPACSLASLPAKLSANYLHGFLSVSMLSRSLPAKLSASYPSSMLYRSLPAKLPASYFLGFLSVRHAVSLPPSEALCKLLPRFRLRPACCIAPSQRSSPQLFPRFPLRPALLSRSLPAKLSPAISTVSSPSSMLYRSPPAKLSAS